MQALLGPFLRRDYRPRSAFVFRDTPAHYKNMPMQYNGDCFSTVKLKFSFEKDIFLIFAQNIDCGYMLELPR